MADTDIRLGGQFDLFLSISHLFFCWRVPKSIAKLDGGHGRIFPLYPPLIISSVSR